MTKIEKELQRMKEFQLERLQLAMSQIKEESERALVKIEKDGTDGYYSCNSPLTDYVAKAWKSSMALSEMKRMETNLVQEKKKKKKK
jgi:hypothetical protein